MVESPLRYVIQETLLCLNENQKFQKSEIAHIDHQQHTCMDLEKSDEQSGGCQFYSCNSTNYHILQNEQQSPLASLAYTATVADAKRLPRDRTLIHQNRPRSKMMESSQPAFSINQT
ncbi:hypothetical protein T11_13752 [Trichinella zimbabwensis]|uniref:Uncharacterized protein n=1 Tax=Trichinella zimbabwensis TaxID=268475 RepID=A0A0V1H5M9_9BILA|nr:hypothetical protein T11_13752 [Trichinella zimbabwensis]